MKRKEIKARTIDQSNDTTCFNASCNDQKGSQHNKKAKRSASKRLRKLVNKFINEIIDEIFNEEEES